MERVEDDVAFGLESRGWPRPAMLARVPEALDEVGLGGLERHRTSKLSGGQQQRLALAGALAPRPGILVLDEPTANLDPPAARAFAARLAALRRSRAVTIVIVEHRVDVAWPIADRVLALGPEGRPIDVGRPADVLGPFACPPRDGRGVAAGRRRSATTPVPRASRAGRRSGRAHRARRLVRLRRPGRRPRRRVRVDAGRAGRADRHQRLGQVDPRQAARRPPPPHDRRGLPRRSRPGRSRADRPRRAGRVRVPGPGAAVRAAARRRRGDARASTTRAAGAPRP